MTEQGHEGLLTRWSRRKQQTELENQEEEILLEPLESDQVLPLETQEAAEQPVLTDEDMPPIESLSENSDFSMFMSSGVSDKLRNLALRKMFHVPAFNIRDGLDEYDEDYTFFEPLGDLVTCDMKHQIEMQEKKKAEQAALLEEEVDDSEDIEEIEDLDNLEDQESIEAEIETDEDNQTQEETSRHE